MTSLAPCFGQETDQSRPDPLPISQPISAPPTRPIEIQCLCPFCGTFNSGIGKPCSRCEMEDTTATRDATRQRSGLWHVMPPNGPASAGMEFESVVALVRRQLVLPRTVVRGPSTGQLWRLASKIRGLSREFGHCYACGGDIETDETVCPHCDRVQTLPEQTENIAQPTPAPSPAMAERQALLTEPKITVHSINDPVEIKPDPIAAARPVVAERSEHRIPKDDLLTPRDLAKAFQLEFGMPTQADRYFQPSGQIVRKIKLVLTSVAALGVAFALVWPLINVVPQWMSANSAKAGTPAASVKNQPTLLADARLASDLAFSAPEMVPPVQPPSSPPVISVPIVATPATAVEPTPVASTEDDPTLLWSNGMSAESSHNYAAAVAAYERIESLPSTMWPAQLETRLTLARKELKGEVR